MKKRVLVLGLALIGLGNMAMAQDFNQYLSAKAVLNHTNNKLEWEGESLKKNKNVGAFRVAYGIAIPLDSGELRTELEYGYNGKVKFTEDTDDGDFVDVTLKSQSLMANIYYDFYTGTDFTPYVGAGLGYARLKNNLDDSDGTSFAKSSNNFAWNASVGFNYALTANLDIDVSYRFTDYGKVKHTGQINGFTAKQRGNEFNLGIRYRFPQ